MLKRLWKWLDSTLAVAFGFGGYVIAILTGFFGFGCPSWLRIFFGFCSGFLFADLLERIEKAVNTYIRQPSKANNP